ncbi:hypothetical protein C162_20416 [Paenibacillus sp. FSL R7-269]|uniref:hypothetical protein n=1 Tax=Paenibacillus sp. FSL R7-269 TaxID=1226755 RepID=UPI0003E2AA1F|nr:hypothetical protein [Paenibacillus sp. FSL R7-269]ETT45735.1 hypothetical protein C162_20416 [Paenibacillus sp. FSL R7-269]
MIKDYAKFSATVAKGIKVGDTEVEIKLLLPLRVMQENFLFLSSNQGEKINVFMGDPQAAFDFGEEDGEIYREVTGRRVTTDASGVVVDIEQREDGDPNQVLLFDQEGEGGTSGEGSEAGGSNDADHTEGQPEEQQEGSENEHEHADQGQGESLEPEWLNGEGGGNGAEVEKGGSAAGENAGEENQGEGQNPEGTNAPEEVSKDALESFILTNRPVYDDIEIDGTPILFPELLQERLELNKTWKEIAQEKEVSPSVLSAKWGAYKKRVERKMMKGDGGAA